MKQAVRGGLWRGGWGVPAGWLQLAEADGVVHWLLVWQLLFPGVLEELQETGPA